MENGISLNSTFKKSEDVVSRDIEGEIIIVPIVAGLGNMEDDIYTLNETGKEIWMLIDGKSTLSDIINKIANDYDVSKEKIITEVFGFANELKRRKFLVEI